MKKSYISFNDGIDVNLIKIDSDTEQNFEEAKKSENIIKTSTVFLTKFHTKTLLATYFPLDSRLSQVNFSIYKKKPSQKYYTWVGEITNGTHVCYDYNIVSNGYYHYLVSVEQDINGVKVYQNFEQSNKKEQYYLSPHFGGWSICDIELTKENNVYKKIGFTWNLGLNLQQSVINQNYNNTMQNTIGKYGNVSLSNNNFDSGSFTGLLGNIQNYINNFKDKNIIQLYTEKREHYNINNERWEINSPQYEFSLETEKLQEWKKFCNDKKLKLLKDTKGNAWIVTIVDSPNYDINYNSNLQQTIISFNWVEVADINNSSIINFNPYEEEIKNGNIW